MAPELWDSQSVILYVIFFTTLKMMSMMTMVLYYLVINLSNVFIFFFIFFFTGYLHNYVEKRARKINLLLLQEQVWKGANLWPQHLYPDYLKNACCSKEFQCPVLCLKLWNISVDWIYFMWMVFFRPVSTVMDKYWIQYSKLIKII